MTRAAWPAEIRERALAMIEAGRNARDVANELRIPVDTIYHWRQVHNLRLTRAMRPSKPRTKKAGSGVIAPAPYARGLIFPGGSRGRWRGE